MTIEKDLTRIATALEGLLALAENQSEPLPEKVKAPAPGKPSKPAATSSGAAPAATAEAPSSKPTSGAEGAGPSKDDLRALLVAFQEEHGADAARELIQPYGKTIGKIEASDYAAVAAAVASYEAV